MSEHGSRAPDAGWFRGVVEQVVAGIVIVQDGRFAYANPRAIEMLGHPALLGASVRDLLDEHQIQRHATVVRELIAGERERAYNEYDVVLPSGAPLQCAVSSSRTEWQGEPAVLGVLHDISAQTRAIAALRESEERYRSTVDSLEEGLLIFDAEGHLKGANGVAEKLLHRSFSELQSSGIAGWRPLDEQGREIAPDDIPVSVTLATGRPLRSLPETLAALPSSVQERWFARLFLLKPMIIVTLASFWLASGLIGLGQREAAEAVLVTRGVAPWLAEAFVLAGALLDIALGAAMLRQRTMAIAAFGMIAVTAGYLAAGTVLTPGLWVDPLGPFVKTLPAALLALVALAVREGR